MPLRAARLVSLAALTVLACSPPSSGDAGFGDAGTTDAGTQDAGANDAGRGDAGSLDAGAADAGRDCTVKTNCPCFSNDDCAAAFVCHSEDATGLNVWCIPGARGTGAAGAPCTGEADCASALCVDGSSGKLCSALCTAPAECPSSLPRCLYVGFGVDRSICAPP